MPCPPIPTVTHILPSGESPRGAPFYVDLPFREDKTQTTSNRKEKEEKKGKRKIKVCVYPFRAGECWKCAEEGSKPSLGCVSWAVWGQGDKPHQVGTEPPEYMTQQGWRPHPQGTAALSPAQTSGKARGSLASAAQRLSPGQRRFLQLVSHSLCDGAAATTNLPSGAEPCPRTEIRAPGAETVVWSRTT